MKVMPKTFLLVSDRDFEAEVASAFGRSDFNFQADQEARNGSQTSFHVDGKLDDYNQERIRRFETGEWPPFISQALLDELCHRGRIAPGDYLIRISY